MAFDSSELQIKHKYFGLEWNRRAEQEQGSVRKLNTKGSEDAHLKGNLCPSVTPNLTPSLKLLFHFNRRFACLETRVNSRPGSELFPLANCWSQIYPKLAGSCLPVLQSIVSQWLRGQSEQGEHDRGLKSGTYLSGLGFSLHSCCWGTRLRALYVYAAISKRHGAIL